MAIFKVTPLLLAAATGYFSLGAFAAVLSTTASVTINSVIYHNVEHVERDVVVIGGGSSGTYAAIETYIDPATGVSDDYGVIIFHNIDLVKNYAARLNVTLAVANTTEYVQSSVYADFRTGLENSTYTTADFTAGLMLYMEQLAKYPYLENGFDLPDPVPEDLLLTFGEFAIKYNFGKEFLGFISNFAQGLGDLLSKPTLYVLKNFGPGVIECFTTGFLATAAQDNSLLYESAQQIIGDDNVFLSATIIAVDRSGDCAQVLISTPTGYKFINAQKLVFSITPQISNLAGWDLSTSEQTLFSQFNNSGYYVGVFGNTGLPTGISIVNVADNTTYGFPPLPAAYAINPTAIPDVFNLYYGSAISITDDEVRAAMYGELERLQITELLAYTRHTPFELWVPAEAIAAGFYSDLYALQGQQNTFYTGAAFHAQDSTLLWQFTEALLPNITASLA
ncbi:flavin-containing superfamily Amine oxidase [Botrytis cinerea]